MITRVHRNNVDAKVTGFATVSGDRHTFWAGYAAAELPPAKFEPVGLSFIGAKWSDAQILALGHAYELAAQKRVTPRLLPAIEQSPELAPLLAPAAR